MTRLTERPAGDQMLEIPHGRGETIGERRHVNDARLVGRLLHPAHFVGIQPKRLLAHQMLARLGRNGGDFAMREIRRGDHQGINLRIGAKLAEIGRRLRQPPLRPPPL